MASLESIQSKYLDGTPVSHCSDETKTKLDNAVVKLLKESYEKATQLLSENKNALAKISEFLIDRETITGEEFMNILREFLPENPEDHKEDINE